MKSSSKFLSAPASAASGDFHLSSPAMVALVGYLILIVIVMLPFEMYTYNDETNSYDANKYNFWNRMVIVLLLCVPFFLGVFTINCMVLGSKGYGCNIWTWIIALVTLLWAAVILIKSFTRKSFKLEDIVYV